MAVFNKTDEAYMRRALYLATQGYGRVSPNPMVGAVIVAEGRIIGEGFHRKYGELHAERNAVLNVKEEDRHLLKGSTMYVTLEPCSHYGKTPPCTEIILESGIRRVVVSSLDPFLDADRKGVDVLRKAGVTVETGLLEDESMTLNRKFMTAHTFRRPYVLLKWAQTADGYIAADSDERLMISNPLSEVMMHRLRAGYDAVMAGVDTVIHDNPRLNCRLAPTRDSASRPLKVSFDSERLPRDSFLCKSCPILKKKDENLQAFLSRLYSDHGVTSLMVEGGAKTLRSFIEEGLVDELRIETAPLTVGAGTKAPDIAGLLNIRPPKVCREDTCRGNIITTYIL